MEGFLAIDLAKDKLDAVISTGLKDAGVALKAVPNATKGFRDLFKESRAKGITKLYVCMEATGGYWRKAAKYFHDKGATVFVVNPSRIKAQRRMEQKRSKTDAIDAAVIMRFMKSQLPSLFAWNPPSDKVLRLQSLVRYREMCVGHRTAIQNLLSSQSASREVVGCAEKQLQQLNDQIEDLEERIHGLIASDSHLKSKFDLIATIPGVGDITTAVLLAELRGFAEVRDPRQATAFAGLDVIEESSGTMRKPARISKQGSRLLRVGFIRIAPSSCRRKGVWRFLYQKFLAKGLHKKQAHVAVARKMLELAVAIGVSERPYDSEKHHRALVFGNPTVAYSR